KDIGCSKTDKSKQKRITLRLQTLDRRIHFAETQVQKWIARVSAFKDTKKHLEDELRELGRSSPTDP
ncbi:MAG: hypothetical protein OK457_04180, partial [Thaumarchaeota archaeon]|nr:hypothetical protein [Nitrososphaerota archaeon]